jgi:hypothetical protein
VKDAIENATVKPASVDKLPEVVAITCGWLDLSKGSILEARRLRGTVMNARMP